MDDGKASEGVKDETLNEFCTRAGLTPADGTLESISLQFLAMEL